MNIYQFSSSSNYLTTFFSTGDWPGDRLWNVPLFVLNGTRNFNFNTIQVKTAMYRFSDAWLDSSGIWAARGRHQADRGWCKPRRDVGRYESLNRQHSLPFCQLPWANNSVDIWIITNDFMLHFFYLDDWKGVRSVLACPDCQQLFWEAAEF